MPQSYKVLQRAIPHHCPYDNVYCLFPLCLPNKSKEHIAKLFTDGEKNKAQIAKLFADEEKNKEQIAKIFMDDEKKNKYVFDRPKRGPIKVLRTLKAIREVFDDPENFPSPYKQQLLELTGGYG